LTTVVRQCYARSAVPPHDASLEGRLIALSTYYGM